MKSPDPSRNVSTLVTIIDSIIAYWKAIAESKVKRANPNADMAEFEKVWPNVLSNFFLAETVRTANALRFLSEGREN